MNESFSYEFINKLKSNWVIIEITWWIFECPQTYHSQSIPINRKINSVTACDLNIKKNMFLSAVDISNSVQDSWTIIWWTILRLPPLKCHLIGKLIGHGTLFDYWLNWTQFLWAIMYHLPKVKKQRKNITSKKKEYRPTAKWIKYIRYERITEEKKNTR